MPNLVGIGLSQVPTNSMLGGMAYQDPDRVKIKKLNIDEISQINSEIADTAVDIFLYDTSKDSDGGAWRKRTTHTSWYNETLGTATRGTRREFPAVAVIVAEATRLTIYDGDDPDLPMWMVFDLSGAVGAACNMLTKGGGGQESDITSIACLNAKLVVGLRDVNGSVGEGLIEVNFIPDFGRVYREVGSGFTGAIYNLPISGRNSNSAYSGDYNSLAIIVQTINDVAMTVLPNAPIDDATGLPVPTIAVATQGGVSVIKDDGTVVSKTTSQLYSGTLSSTYYHKNIDISGENAIVNYEYAGGGGHGQLTVVTLNDLTALRRYGRDYANTTSSHPYFQPIGSRHRHLPKQIYKNNYIFTREQNDSAVNGDADGILTIYEDQTAPSNGLINRISSSYNTGWMHGDIKGAFLSDTDATNLVEGDILGGKGTFDDASYWSVGNSWTVSGGVATATSGNNSYLSKDGILTTGARYVIKVTVSSYSTGTLYVYCGTGAPGLLNHYFGISANGTYTMVLDAYNTNFGLYTASFAGVVDNVTVSSVVDQDRSVNGKDLGVIGTINKSPVATGADLVGYSSSSNTSYLEQPYNSDLDYGTGDMYYSVWVYANSSDSFSGNTYIFERSSISDNSQRRIEARMTTPTRVEVYSCDTTIDNNVPVPSDAWFKLDILRRSGEAFVYINGEYHSSTTGAAATRSLTDTSATLIIGNRAYFATRQYGFPSNSKIALFRTGAGTVSAAQVKKMYEDEKMLFQENAKCTLYGSSNAVTTLAYDEDTERLHVGTSAGRSDFQGLRRINNTTTAVTTAISAHDGFIVEQ